MEQPKPPPDLKSRGKKLWMDLCERYEGFLPQELALLHQVCLIQDRMAALNATVSRDGLLVRSASSEEPRAHPGLVELRAQALAQARLFASMRLPGADGLTPQRRQARGAYTAQQNKRDRLRGA